MFGNVFYHALIRKYVVIFGTLFNDIQVAKQDEAGSVIETYGVPLSYGPREKFLSRVEDDPDLNRPYAVKLPRISYEIVGIEYDRDRKLSTTHKYRAKITDGNKVGYTSVFMPVPYNIRIQMSIMTKTIDEGNRIVEQILPFFTPDWTVSANLLDDFDDYRLDLPIILESVNEEDTYEGDYSERKHIIWTLDFVLKGYFFGPDTKAKIIKVAKVNFHTDIYTEAVAENITVQPGLTANGEPTTDANTSISPLLIQETDNYGYVVTIESYPYAT